MKYRRLTDNELANFEKDFITFLSANTVTGEDWEKVKKETPEKAEELINIFSDIVFDTILPKAQYFIQITPKLLQLYYMGKAMGKVILLQIKDDSALEFTFDKLGEQINYGIESDEIDILTGNKKFVSGRPKEVTELIQSGASVTNEELFMEMAKLIS